MHNYSFYEILRFLLLGLAVGVVARLITPGSHRLGVIVTSLLGVVGTIGGGLLAGAAHITGAMQWVLAVAVAALLLLLVQGIRRTR